jgi:hypothetical protein
VPNDAPIADGPAMLRIDEVDGRKVGVGSPGAGQVVDWGRRGRYGFGRPNRDGTGQKGREKRSSISHGAECSEGGSAAECEPSPAAPAGIAFPANKHPHETGMIVVTVGRWGRRRPFAATGRALCRHLQNAGVLLIDCGQGRPPYTPLGA